VCECTAHTHSRTHINTRTYAYTQHTHLLLFANCPISPAMIGRRGVEGAQFIHTKGGGGFDWTNTHTHTQTHIHTHTRTPTYILYIRLYMYILYIYIHVCICIYPSLSRFLALPRFSAHRPSLVLTMRRYAHLIGRCVDGFTRLMQGVEDRGSHEDICIGLLRTTDVVTLWI